jgi:hypothetical protein
MTGFTIYDLRFAICVEQVGANQIEPFMTIPIPRSALTVPR